MSIHYVVRKKGNTINPSDTGKYYLIQRSLGRIGKKELVEDMVNHTSTSRQEAQSSIEYLFEAIPRLLRLGHTVYYDGVGYFCTSIRSEGCDTPEEANAFKKKEIKLHFRPCRKLREAINKIEIHPYPEAKNGSVKKSSSKQTTEEQRILIEKANSIEIARKSIKKGLDTDLIAELTGLSMEEIEGIIF